MRIPLTDLTAQYQSLRDEIDAAIDRITTSGSFILGPEVEAFECEIADWCQVSHGVGVASGTDALYLALLACGIGEGDEVLTTPFTFIATTEAIRRCGATPVFVDIAPDTCNMDPGLLERHITRSTRAILPVHLYGNPIDMTRLMEIARRHELVVVEDCAQSLGATWQGRKVGSFGDAGCLSFFPSKMLGASGDAGMVITNNECVADMVRALRSHGTTRKYYHEMPGINSRLDTLQAAMLRVKLRRLDEWIRRRREVAATYGDYLRNASGISLLRPTDGGTHVYNYFTLGVQGGAGVRNALAAHLTERGIATAVYYPCSLHLQPVYRGLGYQPGDLPESEAAQDSVLSLPMYPEITDSQIEEVSQALMACPALQFHR